SRRQPTATPPMTPKPTGGQSRGEPHPHRRRAGYRAVLADRAFLLLLATSFLFVLCSLVIDVLLTVYVTTTLHRPAWLAGLLFTLSGILVVTTQTMVTRRTERHPHTRVLQLAAALWGVSFVLMWAAATAPAPVVVPGLVAATLCFTAAESLAMPTLNDLVVTLAPAGRQGRYFAMQGLTWIVPQTIAPAAFTWLLDHGTGWPWVTLLLGCGASAAALSRLRRTLPITPPSPAQPEGQ
ncbi:MAG: MFS transporter, partial [Nocardioidaceae bacterium]